MAGMGCSLRVAAPLILLFLVLLVIGAIFFPISSPHVSLPAEAIFQVGGFPVTNSMLGAWFTVLVLIGLFYAATRHMKLVPSGIQNLVEMIVETFLNFVEGVAGRENGRRFFPIVATIFLFVLFNGWLALLPGFGTIGYGHEGELKGLISQQEGFVVQAPLLRPANTDINVPLALALVSFVFVEYWGITGLGFFNYTSKFIRIGGLIRGLTNPRNLFTSLIDIFVGVLEMFSEFIRIVSFTFRLFGNMTAGEILILVSCFLIPLVFTIPFYGLELLIGLIQALIFSGLTLVFGTIASTPHEETE